MLEVLHAALLRSHLSAGGVIAVNVGHPAGSTALESAISATLRAAFPFVARDAAEPADSDQRLVAAVRRGDDQWLAIVKWVQFAMLNAEELATLPTLVRHAR